MQLGLDLNILVFKKILRAIKNKAVCSCFPWKIKFVDIYCIVLKENEVLDWILKCNM